MKIEVGKWYSDSEGLVVKITDGFEGFFTGNNGTLYNRHGCTTSLTPANLVAEVPELSLGDWFVNDGRGAFGHPEATAVMLRNGTIGPITTGRLRWDILGGDGDVVAYCTSPWEVVEPAPERAETDVVFPDIAEERKAFGELKPGQIFNTQPDPIQFTLDGIEAPDIDMTEPGYETLADVLQRAYDQAAKGKGKERHAQAGEPFDEQVMQQGAQRFGVGALLFQAFKKSEESQRLPHDAAIKELLGGIVYLAGAVIALEKGKAS